MPRRPRDALAAPVDEYLGLEQRVERFTCQQLVPELAVEALHVAVSRGDTTKGWNQGGENPGRTAGFYRAEGWGREAYPTSREKKKEEEKEL